MEDCLRVLSSEYLESLINYMESSIPQSSIWGHHYIYNHLKNLKNRNHIDNVSDACLTTIYGPINGKFENCTFIGASGINDYSLFLFTMEKTASGLIECIKNTKRIDWKKLSYIYMQSRYYSKIDNFLQSKGIKQKKYIENVFYLPKEITENFIINIPPEIMLKPLKLQDANLINENWPYKYKNSLQLIETLIQMNGGIGIHKINSGELIGWILLNNYLCPGFLHVVESERHKGYGTILFKSQCKLTAENDQSDICCVVDRGNDASRKMVEKAGFRYVLELTCVDLIQ